MWVNVFLSACECANMNAQGRVCVNVCCRIEEESINQMPISLLSRDGCCCCCWVALKTDDNLQPRWDVVLSWFSPTAPVSSTSVREQFWFAVLWFSSVACSFQKGNHVLKGSWVGFFASSRYGWSSNHSFLCRLASWLELGSQVGSASDHYQLLPMQHGESQWCVEVYCGWKGCSHFPLMIFLIRVIKLGKLSYLWPLWDLCS